LPKTCLKIGSADDMPDRISGYKTGNTQFKLLFYVPLKIDKG
jgi:hypothetical protein